MKATSNYAITCFFVTLCVKKLRKYHECNRLPILFTLCAIVKKGRGK